MGYGEKIREHIWVRPRYPPTWKTWVQLNSIIYHLLVIAEAGAWGQLGHKVPTCECWSRLEHPPICKRSRGRFCKGIVSSPMRDCGPCWLTQKTGDGGKGPSQARLHKSPDRNPPDTSEDKSREEVGGARL